MLRLCLREDRFRKSPLNQDLEVHVNGRLHTYKTGSYGKYTVYYTSGHSGLYEVEIRLSGRTILKKRVRVSVRG